MQAGLQCGLDPPTSLELQPLLDLLDAWGWCMPVWKKCGRCGLVLGGRCTADCRMCPAGFPPCQARVFAHTAWCTLSSVPDCILCPTHVCSLAQDACLPGVLVDAASTMVGLHIKRWHASCCSAPVITQSLQHTSRCPNRAGKLAHTAGSAWSLEPAGVKASKRGACTFTAPTEHHSSQNIPSPAFRAWASDAVLPSAWGCL